MQIESSVTSVNVWLHEHFQCTRSQDSFSGILFDAQFRRKVLFVLICYFMDLCYDSKFSDMCHLVEQSDLFAIPSASLEIRTIDTT